MRTTTKIGILLLLVVGCKDSGDQPLPPSPYDTWRSHNLHSYAIDQVRDCFCPDAGQAMRIRVRSDTIASVVRLSDGSLVTLPASKFYLTVDSLFAIIRSGTADSLVVSYDEEYGYPKTLDINPQLHPVDGGVLYTTSNLQVP